MLVFPPALTPATTYIVIDTFQIYYHGPNEIPSQLRRIVNEDPEQGSYISLSLIPVMIKSQESTRKLFEFQRKCRFEEESTLVNFPQIYTQDLCRLDCRMQKFLEVCKCLPFFYKRKGRYTLEGWLFGAAINGIGDTMSSVKMFWS